MVTVWHLFLAFFRASNFSFGGGSASIPLIRSEVVDRYQWLENSEFSDYLAICNSLPAPILTKMAGLIGYRIKGWLGALAAIIGAVLPTTLVVVLFGGLISKYAGLPVLEAMLKGVRPVVAVLLIQTALQMGKDAFRGKLTWFFGIVALAIMVLLPSVHPAFLVVFSMLAGYILFKKEFN